MAGITDFWTYLAGTVLIILLPGPNSLFVLSVAMRRGVRVGYQAASGVLLGDAILMLLTVLGAASLLKANPMWFVFIKTAGAAYLAWIGVSLLHAVWQRRREIPGARSVVSNAADLIHPFRRALLLCLTNPKAILFFISFFTQFVDPAYPEPMLSFLILGSIVETCSALYLSVLIFSGARVATLFRGRPALADTLTMGVGALFVGFGAKLATATLN